MKIITDTEKLVGNYIKTVTKKVILDVLIGWNKDMFQQIKLLREIIDDLEYEFDAQCRKATGQD